MYFQVKITLKNTQHHNPKYYSNSLFTVFLAISKQVIEHLYFRSLQGNNLTGRIPEVIGLMQALAVL
jgi:hypothetical protein